MRVEARFADAGNDGAGAIVHGQLLTRPMPSRATSQSFSLRKTDYQVDLDAPGYTELLDAMFAQHDRNRDGVVTPDEYVDPIPAK